MNSIIAAIAGPEIWIVGGIIVLLFGGSQLPKLARSFGEAKNEFEKSQKKDEDKKKDEDSQESKPTNEG